MKKVSFFFLFVFFMLAQAEYTYSSSIFNDADLKTALLEEDWNRIALKSHEWKQVESNCTPYLLAGYSYIHRGEYNKAMNELSCTSSSEEQKRFLNWIEGLLNENPGSAIAYFLRGDAYARMQRYNSAIDDFTRTLAIKHDWVVAYNARGIIYALNENYDLSMNDLNKAIDLDCAFADAYNSRGIVNIFGAKYDAANADFTKAINLKPDYALAFNGRGVALLLDAKYDSAIEDFTKSLQISPDFSEAYINREIAYLMRAKGLFAKDLAKTMEITPAGVLKSVCIGITGINSEHDDLAGHWAKTLFPEKSFSSYIITHEGSPLGKLIFRQTDKYPNVIMLPRQFNENQIENTMSKIFSKAKAEGREGISITLDQNLGLGYLIPGMRKGEMEYTAKVTDKILRLTETLAPGANIKEVVHSAGSGPVLYQNEINKLSSLLVLSGRYSATAWGEFAKQHSSVQIMLGSGDRDFSHLGVRGYEVIAKENPNIILFNLKSGLGGIPLIKEGQVHSALANPSTVGKFDIYTHLKGSNDYFKMPFTGAFGDAVGGLTYHNKPQGPIPGYYTSPDRPLAEVNIMSNMALNQGWKKIGVVGVGSDKRADMLIDKLKNSGMGIEVVPIPFGSQAMIQQAAKNLGVDGMVGLKPQMPTNIPTTHRNGVLIKTSVVKTNTFDPNSLFTPVDGRKIDSSNITLKYPFLMFNNTEMNP